MEIDGLGYVYFASPVAHANILSIDTSEAKEVNGGSRGVDCGRFRTFAVSCISLFSRHILLAHLLAKGKVRLVEDIIAVVVADSFAAAADALQFGWIMTRCLL